MKADTWAVVFAGAGAVLAVVELVQTRLASLLAWGLFAVCVAVVILAL